MTDLSRSHNLELLPTFTTIRFGALDRATGRFSDRDPSPEGGLNLKYGVTSNLTADVTFNPDFSQVESDLPQIEVNQRFALFYPELRPFFLEGAEIFDVRAPITAVHTRRIVDPAFGAKLTGKVGRTSVGVLYASDAEPGNLDDATDPAFGSSADTFVGRARYDLYAESHVGTIFTNRELLGGHSRLAGVDLELPSGRHPLGRIPRHGHGSSGPAGGEDERLPGRRGVQQARPEPALLAVVVRAVARLSDRRRVRPAHRPALHLSHRRLPLVAGELAPQLGAGVRLRAQLRLRGRPAGRDRRRRHQLRAVPEHVRGQQRPARAGAVRRDRLRQDARPRLRPGRHEPAHRRVAGVPAGRTDPLPHAAPLPGPRAGHHGARHPAAGPAPAIRRQRHHEPVHRSAPRQRGGVRRPDLPGADDVSVQATGCSSATSASTTPWTGPWTSTSCSPTASTPAPSSTPATTTTTNRPT